MLTWITPECRRDAERLRIDSQLLNAATRIEDEVQSRWDLFPKGQLVRQPSTGAWVLPLRTLGRHRVYADLATVQVTSEVHDVVVLLAILTADEHLRTIADAAGWARLRAERFNQRSMYAALRDGMTSSPRGRAEAQAERENKLPVHRSLATVFDRPSHGKAPKLNGLSDHDRAVLDKIADADNLPLVIDGPPGSGKSAALTRTMAAFLHLHRAPEPDGGAGAAPPLQVTARPSGTGEARGRLIDQLVGGLGWAEGRARMAAGRNVVTRRSLFRYQLPAPTAHESFALGRHVGFHRFLREFWGPLVPTASRRSSPDVAWAVISSVTKGMAVPSQAGSSPHWAEPEELVAADPVRRARLPLDDVALVWVTKTVGARYQSWLEDKQYWDDQDLALAALVHVECPAQCAPRWGALLCDDAQDLTRAELALLLRLVGGRHDGGSGRLRPQVPIVFATDHARSSDPSVRTPGALRRALTIELSTTSADDRSEVGDEVGLDADGRPQMTLTRLARVARSWVDDTELPPSIDPSGGFAQPSVQRQVLGIGTEALGELLREADRIVVPCPAGDVGRYLEAEPALSDAIGRDRRHVVSAADVSWSRLGTSVIWGFGSALGDTGIEPDALPHHLYLAISNTRHRLLFVDEPDGDRRLWTASPLATVNVPLVEPDPLHDKRVDPQQHLETAEATLIAALDEWDPDECKRASRDFERGDDPEKAACCIVWADLMEQGPTRAVTSRLQDHDMVADVEAIAWATDRGDLLVELDRSNTPQTSGTGALRRRAAQFAAHPDPSTAEGLALAAAAETIALVEDAAGIACLMTLATWTNQAVMSSIDDRTQPPPCAWGTVAEALWHARNGASPAEDRVLTDAATLASGAARDLDTIDRWAGDASLVARAGALRICSAMWFMTDEELCDALGSLRSGDLVGRLAVALRDPQLARRAAAAVPPLPPYPEVSRVLCRAVASELAVRHRELVRAAAEGVVSALGGRDVIA